MAGSGSPPAALDASRVAASGNLGHPAGSLEGARGGSLASAGPRSPLVAASGLPPSVASGTASTRGGAVPLLGAVPVVGSLPQGAVRITPIPNDHVMVTQGKQGF